MLCRRQIRGTLLDLTPDFSIRILFRMDVDVGAAFLDYLDEVLDRLAGQRAHELLVRDRAFGQFSAECSFFLRSGKETGERAAVFAFLPRVDMRCGVRRSRPWRLHSLPGDCPTGGGMP